MRVRAATAKVVGRDLVANPFLREERHRGIRVAEFLIGRGIDGMVVRRSLEGTGPSYALASAEVRVVVTDKDTLDEILGELPRLLAE